MLFYFNLCEVLFKSGSLKEECSVMQVVMQSCIKLFWWLESICKKVGEEMEMQLLVMLLGKIMCLKNLMFYFIMLVWLSNNGKIMMSGFDSLMISLFVISMLMLSEIEGMGYSIGYIDDYGVLCKVNLICIGLILCMLMLCKVG